MKKQFIFAIGLLIVSTSVLSDQPLLNKVSYQITEQQWVKASKAKAVITINATVSDQNISRLRQSMMKHLQQIVSGDWHITQFHRQATNSGLESVNAQAEIQLPADQLNLIYRRAKSVSQAGQTYSVAQLDFNPSPTDIAAAESALRQKIYKDVQVELQHLKHQFPKTDYFVHQINFMNVFAPMPRITALVKTSRPESTKPDVRQKAVLTAQIVLSSTVKN